MNWMEAHDVAILYHPADVGCGLGCTRFDSEKGDVEVDLHVLDYFNREKLV